VDREKIARDVRRRQAQESLDFEREREQTIRDQIELVISEAEGPQVDAAAFGRMSPEDVAIVKAEFSPLPFEEEDDPGSFFERDDVFNLDIDVEEVDPHAEELARLTAEMEQCVRRQQAFVAYIEALGG
jgi:hypothetical protein